MIQTKNTHTHTHMEGPQPDSLARVVQRVLKSTHTRRPWPARPWRTVIGELLQLGVPVVDAVDDGGWLGLGARGGRGRRHMGQSSSCWGRRLEHGGGCVGCTKGRRRRLDPGGAAADWSGGLSVETGGARVVAKRTDWKISMHANSWWGPQTYWEMHATWESWQKLLSVAVLYQ
jgi:hypothetical protein